MVAILFEGKTDKQFLEQICKSYTLPVDKIKYFNFKGKDNLFNISNSNYNELEKDINILEKINAILIVTDADKESDIHPYRGFETTKNKLEETIEKLAFTIPVDYYIMCDENKQGNLESFLLSVLDDRQKKCISRFTKCYEYDLNDKWVYNTFYKQKKHPFDFKHQNFDLLKDKLMNLFKYEEIICSKI